ncbi:MAG: AIR carboxylase family protein, partial [Bacteroidota bacterium]
VATVALDGARNAGILAAQIMGASDAHLLQRIAQFKEELKKKVIESVADVESLSKK